MDQIKIGKFIASCRKEQGMTQAVLAEKLGISDRAVSKWETGKSMPDSGIMLELCELLKINVNELLSGERIMAEAYDKRAEENLLAMRREVEEKNRQMLQTEYWIAFPAVIAGLVMVFVASFIEMPGWLRITLIVFALMMIFTVAFIAVGIEQKAGYYECQNCHHRYVPTYWQTNLAIHMGRTRYMKCQNAENEAGRKKFLQKKNKTDQGSSLLIRFSGEEPFYASISIVMPDLNSTVKWSAKTVIFSMSFLTRASSNSVISVSCPAIKFCSSLIRFMTSSRWWLSSSDCSF